MSEIATQPVEPVESWPARHPRWVGLLTAGPCWAVLLTAVWLTPNPKGHGTHTQLGMPPCSLLQHTGLPCPTCGLTTSFANTVRLRLGAAVAANPVGPLLTAGVLALAMAGTAQGLLGREIVNSLARRTWWLWALLAVVLGGWAIKLAWGLSTGDLPVH